jgi:mRNA-degrading endonuclease RelE of RelBE toxin-antitoxin system
MKYELRLAPHVRDLVAGLAPDDRAQFERAMDDVGNNPYIDNVSKFALPCPPELLCLYQAGPFRVVYRIIDDVVVDLLNLSAAPYVPPIEEWNAWVS